MVLCNKELKQICTVAETVRVKGGVWDDRGIYIYATLTHLKYIIPGQETWYVAGFDADAQLFFSFHDGR